MQLLSRLRDILIDLIYPRRAICMGCRSVIGLDWDDLCEDCRRELARNWIGPKQPRRSLKLNGAAYCHPYPGPGGGIVQNLKYGSVWILAEGMGEEIARAVQGLHISGAFVVTSVPMHPKRLRSRGKNHAELLARSAAAKLDMEYAELLTRTRNAPQQARLDANERKRNLRGGFAVPESQRARLAGATVLLVDDVCTTGSTARYCAAALRDAGAHRVFFAAYALSGGKKK